MRFRSFHMTVVLVLFFGGAVRAQEEGGEATFGHLRIDSMRNVWHAVLADDGRGRLLCTWSERSATGTRIRSTMLRPFQRGQFDFVTVIEGDSCETVRPAAAYFRDGTALVTWQQGCDGRQSIRGRILDTGGHPAGAVFTINEGGYNAMMPAAGSMEDGAVLVTWQDFRNGALDCFMQRFDSGGQPLGGNVMLNDDDARALQ
ncbi:MAG: hypothetical protein RRA94_09910, partial [Bacteroidota bacterium]|nr:hypothetical protein [Bacteroidota bacterium]